MMQGSRISSPTAKKPKLDACHPINSQLLTSYSRDELRESFGTSTPYTHCVLEQFCDEKHLQLAFEELQEHLPVNLKETDLFKVYQTIDLGNLDRSDKKVAENLPHLVSLRDAIYSEPFRNLVKDITGCGELSERTDCSANLYNHGCHLLCHDDVIGTRRASYIIYLTEKEDGWDEADGGALELYPTVGGKPGTPEVIPTTSLLPHWNTLALFTVQPGKSFHSVQEVFSPSKMRFSISGWFHAPAAPEGADTISTVAQLTAKPTDTELQEEIVRFKELNLKHGIDEDAEMCCVQLTADDLKLLKKWLNPVYLEAKGMESIQERFISDSHIQLFDFLHEKIATKLRKWTKALDKVQKVGKSELPMHGVGMRGAWEAVGPTHKQRYLSCANSGDSAKTSEQRKRKDETGGGGGGTQEEGELEELLSRLAGELFGSSAFGRYLEHVSGLCLQAFHAEVCSPLRLLLLLSHGPSFACGYCTSSSISHPISPSISHPISPSGASLPRGSRLHRSPLWDDGLRRSTARRGALLRRRRGQ
jgi:Rps23 Pro-64 3,4-dihydroxylase Tpa1-like proline 4-hydroxylase